MSETLKELELLKAVDVYCNYYPSAGGEDKELLLKTAKNFTKEEIWDTLNFQGSTEFDGDEKIETTLKKLHQARK